MTSHGSCLLYRDRAAVRLLGGNASCSRTDSLRPFWGRASNGRGADRPRRRHTNRLPITMLWDVVVVGAGAAGLLAAARAAERGRRTLLLEKNRKPGVKVLMSGGTRCNITHDTDARGIIGAFGSQGKFLHSALAALGPHELVALIEAE